jgi:hypothetical protein
VHTVKNLVATVHNVGVLKVYKAITIGMAGAKIMGGNMLIAYFGFPFIGVGNIRYNCLSSVFCFAAAAFWLVNELACAATFLAIPLKEILPLVWSP